MPEIHCTDCGKPYPEDRIVHRCEVCDGFFDFDGPPDIYPLQMEKDLPGIWKYRHSFSLPDSAPLVTLGEGNTPFLWDSDGEGEVGFKLESLNPTGSYKDRGSAVLVSHLASRQVDTVVEDSSGNAGASFAAYCARAKIKARVFVPESAAGPKRRQIEQYGAELVSIPGPRSETARAVLEEVNRGQVYGSHAYLPFGLPGIATIAYELVEQVGMPIGSVIAPAGHGALILGIMRGFQAMHNAGRIASQPYFVGVQAENCSPMAYGFNHGMQKMKDVKEGNTVAEGVRVSTPVRARAIIEELSGGKGEILGIPENEILPACPELAKKGIYAEPTSGLVWAAMQKLAKKLPRPIILIISGNGLKYYPNY